MRPRRSDGRSAGETRPRTAYDDALDPVVRTIAEHARTVNLDRAEQLGAALGRAGEHALGPEERVRAAELAHQLVGSAGTFGFGSASVVAAELERLFRGEDFTADDVAQARGWVRELIEQLRGGAAPA